MCILYINSSRSSCFPSCRFVEASPSKTQLDTCTEDQSLLLPLMFMSWFDLPLNLFERCIKIFMYLNIVSQMFRQPTHLGFVHVHDLWNRSNIFPQSCCFNSNPAVTFLSASLPLILCREDPLLTAKTYGFSECTFAWFRQAFSTWIAFLTSGVKIIGTFLFLLPRISTRSNLKIIKIRINVLSYIIIRILLL